MATDSPAVAFLSTINDAVADLEKKYSQKYEEQNAIINKLQDEIDELRSFEQDFELHRFKSEDIDNILDELEEIDEKYDDESNKTGSKNKKNKQKKSVKTPKANNDEESDDEDDETVRKTAKFWQELREKLEAGDLEYIKDLVRRNQLRMDEKDNQTGRTLLMLATHYGSYDLVSMCINLGADIDKTDSTKKTPLKIAKERGFPGMSKLIFSVVLMNILIY